MFLTANANKRSAAVELRRGSEIVLRLAERADVFVVSLRPGLAEARGLSAADVRARNDRLIYASISGFGTRGPARAAARLRPARPGGGRDPQRHRRGRPRPGARRRVARRPDDRRVGGALDPRCAPAARRRRHRRDDRALAVRDRRLADGLPPRRATRRRAPCPGRHGTAFPSIAPYETFAAADGQLMLAVGNDRAFASFCEVVGLEELPGDPLYATNGERVRNRAALRALVAERLADDTRERGSSASRRRTSRPRPCRTRRRCWRIRRPSGLLQVLGGLPVARLPVAVDGERARARLGGAAARPRY